MDLLTGDPFIPIHEFTPPINKESIIIITATIGSPYLNQCMESVRAQSLKNVAIYHYIIVDGPQYYKKVSDIYEKNKNENTKLITLPENTGFSMWNGHRIYAAFTWLCNSDYICFLDDDNWFDNTHLEELYKLISIQKLDWVYSLRKIYDNNTGKIVEDKCESLGILGAPYDRPTEVLIDTSCYLIKKDIAIRVSMAWNIQYYADRVLSQLLIENFKLRACTMNHTLNYRIGNNHLKIEYFEYGNKIKSY